MTSIYLVELVGRNGDCLYSRIAGAYTTHDKARRALVALAQGTPLEFDNKSSGSCHITFLGNPYMRFHITEHPVDIEDGE